MDIVKNIIDIFLHLDDNLTVAFQFFGIYTYILLFVIIFLETGAVVTPFLPGDSLLFAAGTLSATGALNIFWLYPILAASAIIGDTVNYWIGHIIGVKVFKRENARFLKKEYLEKTQSFYAKHGGKTIILARFVPIIRTFAPFVAGVGKMHYGQFISYNLIGGIFWVTIFTLGGYWFGNLPLVKENFHIAIMIIILLSILPGVFEYIKHKKEKAKQQHDKTTYETITDVFKKQHLSD